MNRVLADLSIIAHGGEGIYYPYTDVDIISIEMKSPLKIALAVAKIPKSALRAFRWLCERVIFHEEEKSLRAAMAANAWEDVYAKRLNNIRTAIDMAAAGREQLNDIAIGHMDRLVEDVVKLEKTKFQLKKFELDEAS